MCLCRYHTILVTVALWGVLKWGNASSPKSFFFFKIVLAVVGLLSFHMNFKVNLPLFTGKPLEVL